MLKCKNLAALFFALLLVVGATAPSRPARAATFVVNDPGDGADADLNNSACDTGTGSGPTICTLRAALLQINASQASTNSITFAANYTITPGSQLPVVAYPTTIDATGHTIVLDGANAGDSHGLILQGGASVVKGMTIDRFQESAIQLTTAGGDAVQSCILGTNAAGLGNKFGIFCINSSNNVIGGSVANRNIISGNTSHGIFIEYDPTFKPGTSDVTTNTTISYNYIGTTPAGNAALGNGGNGIQLQNSASNTISNNVISGNGADGVILYNGSNTTTLTNNTIGLGADGTTALGNTQHGLEINASGQTIVGSPPSGGNTISSNGGDGIHIVPGTPGSADSNNIRVERIGTAANGTGARGNGGSGILVYQSSSNNIASCTIAANHNHGVIVLGATGTDANNNTVMNSTVGGAGLGNLQDGIHIENAANATVQAVTTVGNGANGVLVLSSHSTGALIQNSFIGTDANGTTGLGNSVDGIQINSASGATVKNNVVSGNGAAGVFVDGPGVVGTIVQNNHIGTTPNGASALGNGTFGVFVYGASNNTIGASSATGSGANTIAYNTQDGIFLTASGSATSVSNPLFSNVIYSNGGLGINLDGGPPLANDAGDADTGANNRQNYPTFDSAIVNAGAGTTALKGSLNSTPNTIFTLQYYTNTTPDPSGYGEGQTLVRTTTVSTDSAGNASINESFTTTVLPVGGSITATATDPTGNTSEFAADITAIIDTTPPTATITNPANNSQITSLPSMGGTAHDNVGGSGLTPTSVTVSIQRTSDNHFWTGNDWSATQRVLLPVSFDPPSGQWQKLSGLPTLNIADGSYIFQANAVDRAGNSGDSAPVTATPLPPAPTITGFSPTSGPIGTTVVISGTNLSTTNGVSFNGIFASFTVNSASQVTVQVPLKATDGPIQVSTLGGIVTSATNFIVTPSPTPTPGPTPGGPTPTPGGPTPTPGGPTPTPNPNATPTPGGPTPTPGPGVTPTPGGPTPVPTATPIPALSLTVSPNSFGENAGANAAIATVTRNTGLNTALTVTVTSSDTNQVAVPTTVIIPAGQTSTTFAVGAVSNGLADGNHVVTLTATALGFPAAVTTVLVSNTDSPLLTLTILPARFSEAAGSRAATGIVRRNTPTKAPLVVHLKSNNLARVRVPLTVTIPANAVAVSFPVTAVNNTIADGPQQVTITATASGYTSGLATVIVTDNDPASSLSITGRCTVLAPTSLDPNLRLGVAGVTVSLFTSGVLRDEVVTDASGVYRFTHLPAGTYTVIPGKLFYLFAPITRTVTISKPNSITSGLDFTGTPRAQIGGRVTRRLPSNAFVGVVGVSLTARNTQTQKLYTARTDVNGRFLFDPLPLGTYVVTPTLRPTYFAPRARTVTLTPTTIQVLTTNFIVAGVDTIAPTVTISPVLAGTTGPTHVSGTSRDAGGSGVASVTLAIARFANATSTVPTGYYNWNKRAFLPTYSGAGSETLVPGTGTWTLTSLPTLPSGFYGFRATATDFAGNLGSSPFTRFTVLSTGPTDNTLPTISITTPTPNATLKTLTIITGQVGAASSGAQVQAVLVQLVRVADGKYFDGTAFVTPPTGAGIALPAGYDLQHGNWARRTGLPTAAQLTPGTYHIIAIAADTAGNRGQASSSFTVPAAPTTIALSTAVASATSNSVTLRFSGALDAATASDAAHYSVTINSQAVTIESAGYNATTHSVSLGLPDGALKAGDTVTVTFTGLSDSAGHAVSGQAGPVTAK